MTLQQRENVIEHLKSHVAMMDQEEQATYVGALLQKCLVTIEFYKEELFKSSMTILEQEREIISMRNWALNNGLSLDDLK